MKDISFNLETNLQKLSTLRIAAALWGNKNMQDKIKTYSLELEEGKRVIQHHDEDWDRITNQALTFVEMLKLPNKMLFQLRKWVFFMGEKIFIWMSYVVKNKLYKFSKFSFKLPWTSHGLIDERKIYDDLKIYRSFPGLDDSDDNKMKLWTMASLYGDFEFLQKESLEELRHVIRKYVEQANLKNVNTVVTALLSWYFDDVPEDWDLNIISILTDDVEQVRPSKQEKMFLYFVGHGFDKVAEYFYNRINYDCQIVLKKALFKCLRLSNVTSDFLDFYQQQRGRVPELFYILNKMLSMEKAEFLRQNVLKLYLFFLNIWPYQDFCIPFIDYVWNDLNRTIKLEILKVTLDAINSYSEVKLDIYNSLYQPVMIHLLQIMSEDSKVEFFIPNRILFEFFEISNFSTIELILNDAHLSNYRSQLIDISHYLPDFLKTGGSLANVRKYMNFLKFTPEDKKNLVKFSDDCWLFETFILQGRIKMADEILKWQCEVSDEEIIYRKRMIRKMLNPLSICYSLINSIGFYTMEKYLAWIYDEDTNKLEIVKKAIFSADFICETFWVKWIHNISDANKAKEVCSEHLKKFLKQDELMSFKKILLEREYFVKVLLNHTAIEWDQYDKIFQKLDHVFEIFSISTKEINQIKENIRGSFKFWIHFFKKKGYGLNVFFSINALINWITETEEERNVLIRKYLTCRKIALFWIDILKDGLDPNLPYCWGKVREVLLKWVIENQDIIKIKNKIQLLKGKQDITKGVLKMRENKYLDKILCL